MSLDIATLQLVGALVIATSGFVLVYGWLQVGRQPALLWWAGSNFLYALCVTAFTIPSVASDPVMTLAAAFLINLTPGLIWAGLRVFNGRPTSLAALTAGPAFWLIVVALTSSKALDRATIVAGLLCQIAYLGLALFELWRDRGERLSARWPLIVLFGVHLLIHVGGLSEAVQGGLMVDGGIRPGTWFSLIHFQGIFYAMGTAIFFLLLCRDRREAGYQRAARVDGLTGLANRRAFLERATALIERARRATAPVTLLVVDIDHFKTVNDQYGHAVGDRVLAAFGLTARRLAGAPDIVGRLGGDEFAIMLPGRAFTQASAFADTLRERFELACAQISGLPVHPGLSIGIALVEPQDTRPEEVIERADSALYDAKRHGRDRNRIAPRRPENQGVLARIA